MAFPPRIAVASRNPHKLREIARICAGWPVEWVTVRDDPQRFPEVEETGDTYLENASLDIPRSIIRGAFRWPLWRPVVPPERVSTTRSAT